LDSIFFTYCLFIFCCFFGWLIKQELLAPNPRLPLLSKTALFIVDIPSTIRKILSPSDLVVLEQRFPDKSGFVGETLDKEAFLLLSRYDGTSKESIVELVDLTSFDVVHTWNPNITQINSLVDASNPDFRNYHVDRTEDRYRIFHPILNSDGSLIFQSNGSPLVKIDYCNNLVWQNQEDSFNHSAELDANENIWNPVFQYPYSIDEKYIGDRHGDYKDYALAKTSQDGKILFQKSISNLFIENDMKYLLFSVGDESFDVDPIGLNDVQPVFNDSDYWKKGDLFLSLRNQSMIILYRPSSNEILWTGTGHTYHQHDVNVLNDHQISIFNNNSMDTINGDSVQGHNEVLIYDFKTNEYSSYLKESLSESDVRTITEGRSRILDGGDLFIEESNYGRLLYFNKDGTLRWEYINRSSDENIYLLSWSRILSNPQDVNMVKKLKGESCNYE
jgi:hypothetical protein